ncbi:flagellar basal body rod protein FlgB [Pseudacidovorax intermedius]|uniref:flagellar basal body rod protein FlgB n=1 Tax=Pseudacidovorax intermedius TaxID=433924 RepID=UPI000346C134|nr:flagellar basal body protein [Pseudacidovorax intermedius]
MNDGIEAVTRSALALALDAASMRQRAIATNIANANVVGYVPQQVSFEAQLTGLKQGMEATGRLDPAGLGQVRPFIEPAADHSVKLDAEAAEMARNAVHYQALVKGLSRHFAILSMAAGDGRK